MIDKWEIPLEEQDIGMLLKWLETDSVYTVLLLNLQMHVECIVYTPSTSLATLSKPDSANVVRSVGKDRLAT